MTTTINAQPTRGADHGAAMRRGAPHTLPPTMVPAGQAFPDGIDGAVSDGLGRVRLDDATRARATARAARALAVANTAGLPMLTADGALPAGVHAATHGEFLSRFGGTPRRHLLIRELRESLAALRTAGVDAVVVGGSFVGAKPVPGDIDMSWLPNSRTDERAVRRAVRRAAARTPGISVFPAHHVVSNAPTLKGAVPGESFLEFFQHDRTGAPRGSVLLSTADDALDALQPASAIRHGIADHAARGLRALTTIR